MSYINIDKHHRFARIASIGGIMSIATAVSGASVTGLLYSGRTQEHYSIFNHFISELGNYQWSKYAIFFNSGLVLCGIALIFFLNASAMLLRTPLLRTLLMICGTVSGIACSLVGVFSESNLPVHLTVAPIFFVMMFISVIIYCIAVWIETDHHLLDRRYVWAGVPAFVSLIALIVLLVQNAQAFLLGPQGEVFKTLYHRPDFWHLPFVEWMVFISLLGMVGFFSTVLLINSRNYRLSLQQIDAD